MAGDRKLARKRAEYEALEDTIARDKWAMGDWLVANVPSPGVGKSAAAHISLADVSSWRGRDENWLRRQRQMAGLFPPEVRLDGYSPSTHEEAWRQTHDVDAALTLLKQKQTTRAIRPVRVMASRRSVSGPSVSRPISSRG